MTGRDDREDANYGFVRRVKPDLDRPATALPSSAEPAPVTPSYEAKAISAPAPVESTVPMAAEPPIPVPTMPGRRPGRPRNRGQHLAALKVLAERQQAAPPPSTMPIAEDRNWVVRPKTTPAEPSVRKAASPQSAAALVKPGYGRNVMSPSAPEMRVDVRSRRWLAIGLAGTVYIAGAAGLWSMYRTFEGPSSPSLTPAGDRETLPPLDETIDVRDALLDDDVFRPVFKPDFEAEEDVANSDLQTQS